MLVDFGKQGFYSSFRTDTERMHHMRSAPFFAIAILNNRIYPQLKLDADQFVGVVYKMMLLINIIWQ